MAFRSDTGVEVESETYFALYIITRGNKKIYAHLEIVEPGGATEPEQKNPVISSQQTEQQVGDAEEQALNLLQRLQRQKSIIITGVQFQADDQLEQSVNLSMLISLLNLDPSLSFYVVSHLREGSQSLSRLIERSNTRAIAVRQALIAGGIEEARIVAAGVGPLAPPCAIDSCDQRIELVLR
jgi:outer membrane protein OmpA-like peptidoglycan-associated protein